MARTSRPSITLGIPGDPYTLFYDYDQVEGHKLTSLTKEQKAIWFERRLRMAFLEPLRRIWKERTVFESLLESKLDSQKECSFSIAAMGIMLNVVEALGSFRNPELATSEGQDCNWKMFLEFLSNHMRAWNVCTGNKVSVPKVLWKSFRNGIAHDLRVGRSLRMVVYGEAWSFEITLPTQTDEGLRNMGSFCEFVWKIFLMISQLESKSTLLSLKKVMSYYSIIFSPDLMKCTRISSWKMRMTSHMIAKDLMAQHNLTDDECQKIV